MYRRVPKRRLAVEARPIRASVTASEWRRKHPAMNCGQRSVNIEVGTFEPDCEGAEAGPSPGYAGRFVAHPRPPFKRGGLAVSQRDRIETVRLQLQRGGAQRG